MRTGWCEHTFAVRWFERLVYRLCRILIVLMALSEKKRCRFNAWNQVRNVERVKLKRKRDYFSFTFLLFFQPIAARWRSLAEIYSVPIKSIAYLMKNCRSFDGTQAQVDSAQFCSAQPNIILQQITFLLSLFKWVEKLDSSCILEFGFRHLSLIFAA